MSSFFIRQCNKQNFKTMMRTRLERASLKKCLFTLLLNLAGNTEAGMAFHTLPVRIRNVEETFRIRNVFRYLTQDRIHNIRLTMVNSGSKSKHLGVSHPLFWGYIKIHFYQMSHWSNSCGACGPDSAWGALTGDRLYTHNKNNNMYFNILPAGFAHVILYFTLLGVKYWQTLVLSLLGC